MGCIKPHKLVIGVPRALVCRVHGHQWQYDAEESAGPWTGYIERCARCGALLQVPPVTGLRDTGKCPRTTPQCSLLVGRRIYLASSWRNPVQPPLVTLLRDHGHEVYDFRNPRPGDTGFAWSDIDPEWLAWQPAPFRDALAHPVAQAGFESDFDAMQWADTFVLALPCGRSAHLEAGWAIGAGKPTAILLHEDKFEPELMYLMADLIAVEDAEVCDWLASLSQQAVAA